MLFFVKTENKHSKDDKRARERSQSLSFNEGHSVNSIKLAN